MAALTADRITKSKGPVRLATYKVAASTTIYAGAMVCMNATGYAVPAADTAAFSPVKGIAVAKANNSAGADGAIDVVVEYGGDFLIDVAAGITQADVGDNATVVDDQTASDAAATTNDIVIGPIKAYLDEAQDKAWITIPGLG